MSFESIAAAQRCREYLGIKGKSYIEVTGYVDGSSYTITVSSDHRRVEFGFNSKISNFQYFNTLYQNMEWDEEERTLTISSDTPEYSFDITFPEQ